MIQIKYLFILIILFGKISLPQNLEIDTLYLFSDTTKFINFGATYVDDVNNFGVKIKCDSASNYKIQKILVLPLAKDDTLNAIWDYKISLGKTPEDSVLYESTTSYQNRFPKWEEINISKQVIITKSKYFFLTGGFLYDLARTEYLINLIPNQFIRRGFDQNQRWFEGLPFYYPVKVVVSRNITGIYNENYTVTGKYSLLQNYPNPFNSETRIVYKVPIDDYIKIEVVDLLGRVVKLLFENYQKAGQYSISLNADGLSGGIYFIKMQTPSFFDIKKAVYLK